MSRRALCLVALTVALSVAFAVAGAWWQTKRETRSWWEVSPEQLQLMLQHKIESADLVVIQLSNWGDRLISDALVADGACQTQLASACQIVGQWSTALPGTAVRAKLILISGDELLTFQLTRQSLLLFWANGDLKASIKASDEFLKVLDSCLEHAHTEDEKQGFR